MTIRTTTVQIPKKIAIFFIQPDSLIYPCSLNVRARKKFVNVNINVKNKIANSKFCLMTKNNAAKLEPATKIVDITLLFMVNPPKKVEAESLRLLLYLCNYKKTVTLFLIVQN